MYFLRFRWLITLNLVALTCISFLIRFRWLITFNPGDCMQGSRRWRRIGWRCGGRSLRCGRRGHSWWWPGKWRGGSAGRWLLSREALWRKQLSLRGVSQCSGFARYTFANHIGHCYRAVFCLSNINLLVKGAKLGTFGVIQPHCRDNLVERFSCCPW